MNATRGRHRWLLILTALLLLHPALVRAQGFPVLSGQEVGLVLHVVDHPSLGDAFVRRTQSRAQQMLQTLLGFDGRVPVLDVPPLRKWLRDHELEELTPDLCRKLGLDQVEKVVVLVVRRERGTYVLSAREYDRHFDSTDRPQRTSVLQRELVPDALGRLALRCWSPVGQIVARSDKTFTVRFPRAAALSSLPQWSRLQSGAVLQLIREVQTSEGLRQKPRLDQFLIANQLQGDDLECRLALQESPGPGGDWFQYLGHSQARYLVRRVSAAPGSLNARVVFQDSGLPREGCEVAVSESLLRAPQPLGHTGPTGELAIPPGSSLLYVTVQYEDQKLTRVAVPGITANPLIFQIAPRTMQGDSLAEVVRLEDRLRDTVAILNDLVKQMNEASQLKDVAKMQELLEQAQREVRLDELLASATTLQGKVPSSDPAAARLTTLIADIRQTTQQSGTGGFQQAVTNGRIEVLKQEIGDAYRESRWADAEQRLREYTRLNPGDATAKSRLDELTAGLPDHGPEHRTARVTIEKYRGFTRIQELLDRWPELQPALELLIAEKDRLWLMTAEKEFSNWITLANQEAARIRQIVDSGTTLDDVQRDDLTARAKQLEQTGNELAAIVTQTDGIIAGP